MGYFRSNGVSPLRVASRYAARSALETLKKWGGPEGLAVAQMLEEEAPGFFHLQARGELLEGTVSPHRPRDVVVSLHLTEKVVTLAGVRYNLDPKTGEALRMLASLPFYRTFQVQSPQGMPLGTVQSLSSKLKKLQMRTPQGLEENGEHAFREFEVVVLQELSDSGPFYHATRASNLPSIRKKGLLPSAQVGRGTGWSQFNLNLQDAVYLTLELDYARQIALTLASRWGEDAVVLEVGGDAIRNYSRLVVDEDIYEKFIQGQGWMSLGGGVDEISPRFLDSVLAKIGSFGYQGVIKPQHLKVALVVEPD